MKDKIFVFSFFWLFFHRFSKEKMKNYNVLFSVDDVISTISKYIKNINIYIFLRRKENGMK